jgi:hypothetical protein
LCTEHARAAAFTVYADEHGAALKRLIHRGVSLFDRQAVLGWAAPATSFLHASNVNTTPHHIPHTTHHTPHTTHHTTPDPLSSAIRHPLRYPRADVSAHLSARQRHDEIAQPQALSPAALAQRLPPRPRPPRTAGHRTHTFSLCSLHAPPTTSPGANRNPAPRGRPCLCNTPTTLHSASDSRYRRRKHPRERRKRGTLRRAAGVARASKGCRIRARVCQAFWPWLLAARTELRDQERGRVRSVASMASWSTVSAILLGRMPPRATPLPMEP